MIRYLKHPRYSVMRPFAKRYNIGESVTVIGYLLVHCLFLDEAYHNVAGGRAVIVAAWATDQARLSNHAELLNDLRRPGKSPILERIVSVFESLDALAVLAWAELPASVFRAGEIDGTNDIPAVARPDNIWSVSGILTVAHLILHLSARRQDVRGVDVYFDPRSLKRDHASTFEKILRGFLVLELKRFGARLGADRFENLNIRRVQPVEKSKNLPPTRLQNGIWVSDYLCAKSDEIVSRGGMSRIRVEDISEVVRRTMQQFDGKPFYE
jgi:hypothetical protein